MTNTSNFLLGHETVYVLFSIIGKRFDPSLVGVFKTMDGARAAQKMIASHPEHTTAFVLELPLCHDIQDYEKHWKSTVSKKIVEDIKKRR